MKELLLKCKAAGCTKTSKSEQVLRKHRYKAHPELNKGPGRPTMEEADKKTKSQINRDHYLKRLADRSKSTETARTAATVLKKSKRPKRPKAPPKIPYTDAEPSDTISMFHWLPPLEPDEALTNMKSEKFWRECCQNGLDPLWAYRYLRWRLGRPGLTNWRLCNSIPGP